MLSPPPTPPLPFYLKGKIKSKNEVTFLFGVVFLVLARTALRGLAVSSNPGPAGTFFRRGETSPLPTSARFSGLAGVTGVSSLSGTAFLDATALFLAGTGGFCAETFLLRPPAILYPISFVWTHPGSCCHVIPFRATCRLTGFSCTISTPCFRQVATLFPAHSD